jgi:protein-arginine kinase
MNNKILISKYGGISLDDLKDTNDFKFFTYEKLPYFNEKHQSLLARVLSEDLFQKLKNKKTSNEFTFSNVIQSGIECHELPLGIVAGDRESYSVFKDLFYKVINLWHDFDPNIRKHIESEEKNKLELDELNKLNPSKYIVSTRITGVRNISEYPLPAGTNPIQRKEVEETLKKIFQKFKRNFSGKYYKIEDFSKSELEEMQRKDYIFPDPSTTSLLLNSGCARRWPKNRGVFYNEERTIFCWCNEQDHCSIISLQQGHDIKKTFEKFSSLSDMFINNLTSIGKTIMQDEVLGFLSTCPSNLGTGLKVSMRIKIPNLIKNREVLNQICKNNSLEIREADRENPADPETALDILNKKTIGVTSIELIQNFINGVVTILQTEEKM